jgi:hypothetical protein
MNWWAWLLVSLGALLAVWAALVIWLLAAGRRGDARALATFVPDCIVLVTRRAPGGLRPRGLHRLRPRECDRDHQLPQHLQHEPGD